MKGQELRKVCFSAGSPVTTWMTAAVTMVRSTRWRMVAAVGLLLAGVLAPLATPAGASPGTTERMSVDSAGTQGDGNSLGTRTALSADGRFVAFHSVATNLVPGGHQRYR